MNAVNPYEAPVTPAAEPAAPLELPNFSRRLFSAFWRWLIICGIGATPSLFWGLQVAQTAIGQAAMLGGILTFVIVYSYVDAKWVYAWSASNRALKRSLYTVYGLRLLISIAFPVGMFVDMFSGILSISIVNRVLGVDICAATPQFLAVYLTTLVQGTILNMILLSLLGVVYTFLSRLSSQDRFARRELASDIRIPA